MDDPALLAELSEHYGGPIHLLHLRKGCQDSSPLSLIGTETLAELGELLAGHAVDSAHRAEATRLHDEWDREVQRIYDIRLSPLPTRCATTTPSPQSPV